MRTIMKATTYGAIGLATAFLIGACVMLEDRIADVTTPNLAATFVDAGCTGGAEFVEAAVTGLNPIAAAAIIEGVKTACARRSTRKSISATIYDTPLDTFCGETDPLIEGDANFVTRSSFNQRRIEICEARS